MEHYLEDIEESNNKSYPGGKMATVFGTEAKNAWYYRDACTPPYVCCLVKHRDNFTFVKWSVDPVSWNTYAMRFRIFRLFAFYLKTRRLKYINYNCICFSVLVSNLGLSLKIIRSVCEYTTKESVWTWVRERERERKQKEAEETYMRD